MIWFKKIVRAILALLPVFSIFFITSPVFAYKYPINVIPINVVPNAGYNSQPTRNQGFRLHVSNDSDPSNYLARTQVKYYDYGFNPSSCGDPPNTGNLPIVRTFDDYKEVTYGVFGTTPNQPFPSNWNLSPCSDLSNRIDWTGFFQNDVNTDEGLYAETKFSLTSIFGVDNFPNKLSSMTIPLGTLSRSSLDTLSTSSTFDFSGEFVVDFDDPSNSGLSGANIILREYYYSDPDSGFSSPYNTCTSDIGRDDPNDPASVWYIRYNCHHSADSDLINSGNNQIAFELTINFNYSNSNTKLHELIYDSSSVITDGDSSVPPDEWGDQHVYGLHPDQAPGSAKQAYFPDVESGGINWTQSLINLFGFTFINPFAPLLNMFTSQESCAQIPTLAGLLHSDSSEVCPWFPSEVRAISTPVLSIASVMLLFGFAVRWLGSSSGNMFEDASHDTGNYSFNNKFRRHK